MSEGDVCLSNLVRQTPAPGPKITVTTRLNCSFTILSRFRSLYFTTEYQLAHGPMHHSQKTLAY